MAKHRAVIVGAGRIGAGFNWHDDEYTHAGAYRALSDRVELVGFVEPVGERASAAIEKWRLPVFFDVKEALASATPDVVSICTQPDQQYGAIVACIKAGVRGIWCEKPYQGPSELLGVPVQVNYLRRGDSFHRSFEDDIGRPRRLVVYGKDDIHTRCHFEDLAKWWKADLDFRPYNGPCSYILEYIAADETWFFDNGGFTHGRTPGDAMKAMLANLLDHVDGKAELWSPAR